MDTTLDIPGFRCERLLGEGACGRVYLAHETGGLGRPVALKVFSEKATEAFAKELEVQKRVEELRRQERHPGIVQAFASGEHEGRGWIALEYLEAGSLKDLVEREGPLSWEDATGLLVQAAEAVGYLHESGLFHRDIKPANLLLGSDGRVRVSDFGLSRDLEASLSAGGSPAFSAPEVIAGQIAPELRARVDVYGLGATLSYLLTGVAARPGRPDAFALERHGAPRSGVEFLLEAMAYEAEERPPNAGAFALRLKGLREGERPLPGSHEEGGEETPMTKQKLIAPPTQLPERDDVHVASNRCPFCHEHVEIETDEWVSCRSCQARHHEACWTESGACASCGTQVFLSEPREAPPRGRPTSVTVIGWAAMILSAFTILSGGGALLAARFVGADDPGVPAGFAVFSIAAILQIGLAILGGVSGYAFLKLRAWARTILEGMSWLLLLLVTAFALLLFVGDFGPGAPETVIIAVINTTMFGLPLCLALKHLRSDEVRAAVGS